MNKKGNVRSIFAGILIFGIVMFIFLFSTVGLKQIFSENLINPVKTNLSPLVSSGTSTTLDGYESQYNLDWFNYDLFFLLFFLVAFIGSIISAYKETTIGWASFFGYVTIGSYIFLLALTFITGLFNWLMTNFYYGLFDLSGIDTPIISFFAAHISLISFIWFLVILIVNQFDLAGFIKRDSDSGFVEQ